MKRSELSEFARFMESISSEGTETKINELSEILNKVLQIITRALDELTVRMVSLEENVNRIDQKFSMLQNRAENIKITEVTIQPIQATSAESLAAPELINDETKETTKQSTEIPSGAAVSDELKKLFKKMKK